jgi:uncharacterized protein (TIGR02466 family)
MLPFVIKDDENKVKTDQVVKQTMHIEPLFPKPLGFLEMDKAASKKFLEFIKIKKLETVINNGGAAVSSNVYILDNDEFSDIKQVLTDSVNQYFKEIINPGKDVKLYITNSWINVNKNGEYHPAHYHQNSIVSAVLYIDTHKGDTITFENPNTTLFGNLKFGNNTTMWGSSEWTIPAMVNTLIMFPSTLQHMVKPRPNICSGTRISLAFNTWFKGTIGGNGNLPRLHL